MPGYARIIAATRRAWRDWLFRNHAASLGIWLVTYKKGSGRPGLPYCEAVDEAICLPSRDQLAEAISCGMAMP